MSESKVDRLFIRSNCIESAKVRTQIDFGAVTDDGFKGFHGEELRVFTALSKDAATELLESFGIKAKEMPVVLSHDGVEIVKAKNVLMHLRRGGMIK